MGSPVLYTMDSAAPTCTRGGGETSDDNDRRKGRERKERKERRKKKEREGKNKKREGKRKINDKFKKRKGGEKAQTNPTKSIPYRQWCRIWSARSRLSSSGSRRRWGRPASGWTSPAGRRHHSRQALPRRKEQDSAEWCLRALQLHAWVARCLAFVRRCQWGQHHDLGFVLDKFFCIILFHFLEIGK